MKLKLAEVANFFQRFENLSIQFTEKIDFAFYSVIEAEPDDVTCDIADVYYSWQHFLHFNGSIFGSRRLARANVPLSGKAGLT